MDVEADCSMVTAFENPTENPNPAELPRETSREISKRNLKSDRAVPDRPKIAVPLRSRQRIGKANMGQPSSRRKQRQVTTGMPAAAGLEPFGDPDKVNQFCRI